VADFLQAHIEPFENSRRGNLMYIPSFDFNFLTPEVLRPEIQAFSAGLPIMLLHAFVTLLILMIGAAVYAFLTPYKEIDQIRDGNHAAAVSYGGVILSLAIPLAASMDASTSVREIMIWGGVTILIQLFVFRLVDFLLTGLPQRINEGETSAAVLLVAAKLATAFILAAAVAV
jgi:putative membrane protein